jgi:hypothetical protein
MLHSSHDSNHGEQDRPGHSFGSLAHLGKRYALLVGLLALSVLTFVWLGGAPATWATSPVSPVTGTPSGDVTSGSVFWSRIRVAFSWRSPLSWFLIGLAVLGLVGWALLWGLSRLEAANSRRSELDQETIGD